MRFSRGVMRSVVLSVCLLSPALLYAQLADLQVSKTDSPDPVTAGANLTYTITVTNAGPNAAANVTLTDSIINQKTFVSFAAPAGWTATTPPVGATGTVSATNPSFAGGSAVFTLVVNVNPNLANGVTISNTASVSSTTTDPDATNNSSTATTTVLTSADLSVTKTDSPDPVVAGTNLAYTITFTNNGPSDSQNATLTDVIPANTTFVSATQGSGPAFTLFTPPAGGTGTFSATISPFATGAGATFTLVVNVNAGAPAGTILSNTANVNSVVTSDPDPTDNSATATTSVLAQADVSVTKADSPDPVLGGNDLTYTLTLSNTGPSSAASVSLTDVIPANTTFVSATQTAGPAFTLLTPPAGGTGTFSATSASFAAGATATFALVVNVNAGTAGGTIVSNSATVTSTTTETNAANNTATETTLVTGAPDLVLTKTDSPEPVTAGNDLTYTLTLTNIGPTAAQTVSLSDVVPANTTFVSAAQTSGPAFTLNTPPAGGTGTFTATAATFASGATATFTLVVNVNNDTQGGATITNTASVTATTPDAAPANNINTEATAVAGLATAAIPTLSNWMLLLLAAALAAVALRVIR